MTKSIPLAGVIGWPVAHSKSPTLFRDWFESLGVAGYYVPLAVEPENFEQTLQVMPKMGFVGCNVTIPHKLSAISCADVVSEAAQMIGAANTITFTDDGKIYADNTDGYGFITNLLNNSSAWQPNGGPALVLGAGGASRAVIWSLLDAGVPKIILTNRTRDTAETLSNAFSGHIEVIDWEEKQSAISDSHLIVNTTSLGMTGHRDLEISLDTVSKNTLVTDIVYTPLKTKLLEQAEAQGCETVDGLGMLLHQAVPGFERWFGQTPEVTAATRRAVLG